jgi:hypothetical protein
MVDQDMHLKDDNNSSRPMLLGNRLCTHDHPELFDIAVHRPDRASVFEYSGEAIRRNYGKIPSALYPCAIGLDLEVEGRVQKGTKYVKSSQSFILQVAKDGSLRIDPFDPAIQVLTTRPEDVAGGHAAASASPGPQGASHYYVAPLIPGDEPAGPTGGSGT